MVAEKRQSETFSELSFESTKDPMDFTPTSQIPSVISDSEAESFLMPGSSRELSSSPENFLPTNDSPVSTVTSVELEARIKASSSDLIQSIVDLDASVQSIRAEVNELKKIICSVDTCEEINSVNGIDTQKLRIVVLSFILGAILSAIVVLLFNSGETGPNNGPVPT